MSDGTVTRQSIELVFTERISHVAHRAFEDQLRAVSRNDAARFLAAMLQRVQSEIGQPRGIGVAIDAKDAALFAQLVVQDRNHEVLRLSRLSAAFNPTCRGHTS